jgi:hypothetical protein
MEFWARNNIHIAFSFQLYVISALEEHVNTYEPIRIYLSMYAALTNEP